MKRRGVIFILIAPALKTNLRYFSWCRLCNTFRCCIEDCISIDCFWQGIYVSTYKEELNGGYGLLFCTSYRIMLSFFWNFCGGDDLNLFPLRYQVVRPSLGAQFAPDVVAKQLNVKTGVLILSVRSRLLLHAK